MKYLFLLFSFLLVLNSAEYETFEDWRSWEKINTSPFLSVTHRAYVDLYIKTKESAQAYRNVTKEYSIGTTILKPLFPDSNRSRIARLVIMKKMRLNGKFRGLKST